jgi:hypothetical protein
VQKNADSANVMQAIAGLTAIETFMRSYLCGWIKNGAPERATA